MARPSNEEKLKNVHEKALLQFDNIQSVLREERLLCLQDRRFYSIAGAQWEGDLALQFENRPRFEVNKIKLAIIRIINEYRNNKISIYFQPKDGSTEDKNADSCTQLYRSDEQDSCAEEAYDNAFEEALGGGIGAYRLRAEYENDEDDDDERQRIRFEPIFDADSTVFFDLNAKRQDKSDAKYCFVLTSMSHEAYEDEYGDNPSDWPHEITLDYFDWSTPDSVFVAEYYIVETVKETVRFFRNALGEEEKYKKSELEEDEELMTKLEAFGFREVRQKKIKCKKVHKYILSGSGILEDCGYVAGKYIPIVPVYGKRWFVDNIERCEGHVRSVKDAQRLKNMQLSKLGEIAALGSVEKPIFTPEQIAGHQNMWAEDNVKNNPYLLINALKDPNGNPTAVGPTAYIKAPAIPEALAALLQLSEVDIQDLLGNPKNAEELQPNVSGKAIELVQNKLDMQTFIYVSNLKKAMIWGSKIWLSMAKELYVEPGRKMKGVDERGKITSVELVKKTINEEGVEEVENDFTEVDFDVIGYVGPSSDSKRQSIVRSLTGMMQYSNDPETIQILSYMAMLNMEGEGLDETHQFFRKKLVRLGVVQPTEEEKQMLMQEQQNQQPDPNSVYLLASAEKASADAQKAQADAQLTMAKIEETAAKVMEIYHEMGVSKKQLELQDKQITMSNQNTGGTNERRTEGNSQS